MIVVIIAFILFIIVAIACFFFALVRAEHMQVFPPRIERNENTLQDLSEEDFEALKKEDVEFSTYKGAFYYKEKGGDVIMLLHGYGAGHKAYMTEINFFCDNGYTVFGFDYSGCCSSGGRTETFYTAVNDSLKAYGFLKDKLKNKKLILFGHSWGAYTALILSTLIKCDKAIAVCPFDSAEKVFSKMNAKNKFNKILKPFRKTYMANAFGKTANVSAYETAERTKTDTLALFGENDFLVPVHVFKNEKIKTVTCQGKGHNPYNTEQAESYLNYCLAQLSLVDDKQEFLKTVDYKKITEEDETVMQTVFDFLKNDN